jgi:hypothetical protein
MEAETPKSGNSSGTSKPRAKPGRARQPWAPSSREGATVMGVPISKPDKTLWPDAGDGKPVTKLDLARYYEPVGAWMIPHIKGRPCSILRAPDGIAGEQFFQRHAGQVRKEELDLSIERRLFRSRQLPVQHMAQGEGVRSHRQRDGDQVAWRHERRGDFSGLEPRRVTSVENHRSRWHA